MSPRHRLEALASRARYRDWCFDATRAPAPPGLIAYRIVDLDGRVEKLGPWPLPADAGEAEVCAAARLAVAEVDGPDAVAGLEWRPGPARPGCPPGPDARPGGAGPTIRRLREARGWGRARLAAEAGISFTGLYLIEIGRTWRPGPATAARLASALGVGPADLISPESVLPPPPPA